MNTYSRALRYISIKDVKQKHQEKLIEQKIQEEKKKEEEKYIASIMEEKKYDWRKELNEQMTTSDIFFATLPATGDLTISSNDFSDPDTYLFSSSVSGTDVVMVSREDSAPIVGANYTNLRQVRTGNIDTSKSTTIVVSVTKPTSDFPTWQDRDPLENFNDNISVVAYSNSNPIETSVTLSSNFDGTQTFTLPSNLIVSDLRIQFSQFGLMPVPGDPSSGQPNATIRVITTQRQTPMNVFVPLDSPEATSFVRTDPMMANLSPQERLKKLKDMLEASDEYVMKMLGLDFPGTGSVPPGEYDPFKQAPPGEAGDTPGVQVTDYQNAPGYMNIKVGDKEITRQYDRQGNYTGADSGWQPDPNAQSKSGSKSGSQKINFTHTYDVVTDSGVQKQKMNLSTTVPTDASGNLVNPFGNESPKSTNTSSQQKSQIQKAVLSNPEVANAVEKLGTAGKTYIDYLTNNLPAVIDNNYLGQKYVNSIFKNAQINHTGTVSVGDNIVGTGGKATYDPKTKKVSIPFNYDFKTNEQEFNDPSKAGRVNDFQKAVLNAVGPYSADAQLNTPILPLNSLAGIVLGGAIGVSKTLGGGQQRPGNVTMDAGELKKINPALYNQVVKEEFIIERRKLKSPEEVLNKIPGYYDKKPAPLGFPVEPPPEMVNGMHPDLVDGKKVADRFNRLDPESAKAMPLTGNPHIDKKVRAARKKPK